MPIVVFPRNIIKDGQSVPGFEAHVLDQPGYWDCGRTKEEALRQLYKTWPWTQQLGVEERSSRPG